MPTLNCDEKAVLYFDQRAHGRDKRPLEYPIRFFLMANGGRKRLAQSSFSQGQQVGKAYQIDLLQANVGDSASQ